MLAADEGRARVRLESAAEFGFDLRDHGAPRAWWEGYVDN